MTSIKRDVGPQFLSGEALLRNIEGCERVATVSMVGGVGRMSILGQVEQEVGGLSSGSVQGLPGMWAVVRLKNMFVW